MGTVRGQTAWALYAQVHRARGLAESTLYGRGVVFRRLLAHVPKPVAKLTRADMVAYLAARRLAGVSASTQANELAALRAVFRVLVAEGKLRRDPTSELVVEVSGPKTPPLLLSEDQVARLLAATVEHTYSPVRQALSLRDRALLELLYGAALRASEAAGLTVVDLDLQAGSLGVRRLKRGESRVLPLPPAALTHLARYLREGRVVLAGLSRTPSADRGRLLLRRNGLPLDGNDVGQVVRRISKRAGIAAHPHAFRRALATHLARRGVSLELVRLVLGHVDLEHTARYVGHDHEDLRRAVALLPRLEA